MPQTIIKIKTWFCPQCGYYQDFEPTKELMLKHFGKEDDFCPSCKGAKLIRQADPEKKVTITIMGEEDIEKEIEEAKSGKRKDIDVSTVAKENAYRAKRKKDIQEAIARFRLLEDN
jgi:hypothetical protein